jgi:hypothetical protein
MSSVSWRELFSIASRVLGAGHLRAELSQSWCAWTTFDRLSRDTGYWTGGLPGPGDILETYLRDGGVWGQPFSYDDIAHVIVPRQFEWESAPGPNFSAGVKHQDINLLAAELEKRRVPHRLTELVLEVKCY